MPTHLSRLLGAAVISTGLACMAHAQAPAPKAGPEQQRGARTAGAEGSVDRGRYLARIAGCNDCHTANYAQTGGKVPEAQWLTGDKVGFRGPWGTTYPANLRLLVQTMSQAEWMKYARTHPMRPPMPWFALRDMTDHDLASLYRFMRQLGPAGSPAPEFLPPDKPPQGPVITFPG